MNNESKTFNNSFFYKGLFFPVIPYFTGIIVVLIIFFLNYWPLINILLYFTISTIIFIIVLLKILSIFPLKIYIKNDNIIFEYLLMKDKYVILSEIVNIKEIKTQNITNSMNEEIKNYYIEMKNYTIDLWIIDYRIQEEIKKTCLKYKNI